MGFDVSVCERRRLCVLARFVAVWQMDEETTTDNRNLFSLLTAAKKKTFFVCWFAVQMIWSEKLKSGDEFDRSSFRFSNQFKQNELRVHATLTCCFGSFFFFFRHQGKSPNKSSFVILDYLLRFKVIIFLKVQKLVKSFACLKLHILLN